MNCEDGLAKPCLAVTKAKSEEDKLPHFICRQEQSAALIQISAPSRWENVAKEGEEKRNGRHTTKSDFSGLLLKLPSRWFQNIDPNTARAGRNPLLTRPVSLFHIEG